MKTLFFGIHPDDIELSCGGTIARLTGFGHDVVLVDLSRGESSSNGTPEGRAQEAGEAARILGCSTRDNLGLPDGAIQSEDREATAKVVAALRRHKPDMVFRPNEDDPHPDHESGGALIRRALYLSGVHGYEPNTAAWRPKQVLVYPGRKPVRDDIIVDISETMETKLTAISAHVSQFGSAAGSKQTPLNAPNFMDMISSAAMVTGVKVGVRYGEAFQLTAPLRIDDLRDLL